MIREEWFPTSIYHDMINVDGIEEVSQDIKKHQDGVSKSNKGGGWQSDNVVDDKRLTHLKLIIEEKSRHVWKDMFPDIQGRFKISNMWININNKKSYNGCHNHPNSDLSGNLYVKTHENCGRIFFQDPRIIHRMNETSKFNIKTRLTFTEISYVPEDGKILFFPNWISHDVEPNVTDKDRISIAFNMDIEYV
jgi:uncharacterized protein (TIGR02466 family)